MYLYQDAISIIKAFEGFNEKAYPDPVTGSDPYTFGYGTQFYPDGSQVKQGHCCTKEKALEYDIFLVRGGLPEEQEKYQQLKLFLFSILCEASLNT